MTTQPALDIREGYKEKYGFHDDIKPVFKSRKGLDREIVAMISDMKGEPAWMRDFRLKSLAEFERKPLPGWGGRLTDIDFQDIYYYLKPSDGQEKSWDDVPADIKRTFDKLGIPEAEQKFLSGVGAQYDSESVYHTIKKSLSDKGVIFLDTGSALKEHPDLFREYFGTIIPPTDNKFAALNSAVWSGGSFIYVPKGVKVDMPLQAYFRINAQNMGQFERTLIIVDEGAWVHYVEGCTAPIYATDSLHSAVVEIIVKKGARCRYTTIQNWSNNVYNLVTKRAAAYQDATMEWVDANLGSKLTMKYPSVYLMEPGAHAEILSIAFAGKGQHQDAGGKAVHAAPHTTSSVVSKSISKDGGRAGYRGLIKVAKGAKGCKSTVRCDALLLDEHSRSDTYPYMEIEEDQVTIGHEATVSKIGDEQLFYLMSRGIPEAEAAATIVSGFIEPITKELPMEYAVEMNRVAALARRSGDPDFLAQGRAEAWAFVEKTPFPSRMEELWRRTDITRFKWESVVALREPHAAVRSVADLPAALRQEIGPAEERSALLVQVDSTVVLAEHDEELTRLGVTVLPISEAAKANPALVRRHLGATVRHDENRFTGMNAALLSGGAIVHVPAGVRVPRPIRLLVSRQSPDFATFPRIVVALEKGSVATVIEEYFSAGEPGIGVNVGVSEITVGEGAELHMATLQRWADNVHHFGVERVRVGRDARFHWTFAALGGKLTKLDMEMHLDGEGSEAKFSGCYFGNETQHFDFHTFQNHIKGHSTSDLLFKGALRGRARTIYQGLIKVHKDAQRSDAYQANRNLILSDKARADSIPSLEIEANDVRCTHGATVGQVDDEQLFYLMARGLPRAEAERMIIDGFFEPVLARIPAESLRALVTESVRAKAAV